MKNHFKKKIDKIGIAMAVYLRESSNFHEFFYEQLCSIRDQTFKNWVCVVTCDSPLDNIFSDVRLDEFKKDYKWKFIENKSRLGHKKNFEKAIQLVLKEGVDAIACSDQDDLWYPEKLSVLADELSKKPSLSLVHSDMHVFKDGKIGAKTTWEVENRGVDNTKPEHLLVRNVVAGSAMLMDKELAARFCIIPDGAEYHDHWYALVASFYGGVYPIRKPLFAYRQHEINEVGVAPFLSVFYVKSDVDLIYIFKKCVNGWLKSYRLMMSAKESKVPIKLKHKMFFFRKIDLGLGILIMGLAFLKKDKPLARACFARSVGKVLYIFWSIKLPKNWITTGQGSAIF